MMVSILVNAWLNKQSIIFRTRKFYANLLFNGVRNAYRQALLNVQSKAFKTYQLIILLEIQSIPAQTSQ